MPCRLTPAVVRNHVSFYRESNCTSQIILYPLYFSGSLLGLRIWHCCHVHLGYWYPRGWAVQHHDRNLLGPVRHGGILELAVEALEASLADTNDCNFADILCRILFKKLDFKTEKINSINGFRPRLKNLFAIACMSRHRRQHLLRFSGNAGLWLRLIVCVQRPSRPKSFQSCYYLGLVKNILFNPNIFMFYYFCFLLYFVIVFLLDILSLLSLFFKRY